MEVLPAQDSRAGRYSRDVLSGEVEPWRARDSEGHSLPRLTSALCEYNRVCFEQAGIEELEPYKALLEIARTATKMTRQTEKTFRKGKPRFVHTYVEVPDMDARQRAWDRIFLLMGRTPNRADRMTANVQVNTQVNVEGSPASSEIGDNPEPQASNTLKVLTVSDAIALIARAPTDAERIRLYAQMQRRLSQGESPLPDDVIEGEVVENLAPVGATENSHEQ